MWNIPVSKPENHKLLRETSEQIIFNFSIKKRKKKHSSFADTKLQVDQIKKKMVAKFNQPLFN